MHNHLLIIDDKLGFKQAITQVYSCNSNDSTGIFSLSNQYLGKENQAFTDMFRTLCCGSKCGITKILTSFLLLLFLFRCR